MYAVRWVVKSQGVVMSTNA